MHIYKRTLNTLYNRVETVEPARAGDFGIFGLYEVHTSRSCPVTRQNLQNLAQRYGLRHERPHLARGCTYKALAKAIRLYLFTYTR